MRKVKKRRILPAFETRTVTMRRSWGRKKKNTTTEDYYKIGNPSIVTGKKGGLFFLKGRRRRL